MRKKDIAIAKRLFRQRGFHKLYWKDESQTIIGNSYQILYIDNSEVNPDEVKYFDENKTNDTIIDIDFLAKYNFTETIKINTKDINKKTDKPFNIPTKNGTIYLNGKYLFDLLDWCKTDEFYYDPQVKNFTKGGSYKPPIYAKGDGRKGILLPVISE